MHGRAEPLRIVIVEDYAIFAEALHSSLDAKLGYEVVGIAGNGLKALTQIVSRKPDIVLIDAHLPLLSGIDVARFARENHPRAAVIVMSGDSGAATGAGEAGADHFATKDEVGRDLLGVLAAGCIAAERRGAGELRLH